MHLFTLRVPRSPGLIRLVLSKIVFVQLITALGVGLGLLKFEEIKGYAADQCHHKTAHAVAFQFIFLRRLGFGDQPNGSSYVE